MSSAVKELILFDLHPVDFKFNAASAVEHFFKLYYIRLSFISVCFFYIYFFFRFRTNSEQIFQGHRHDR